MLFDESRDLQQGPSLPPITLDSTKEHVHVSTLGQIGHGKATLVAALTRVLAKANNVSTYATVGQLVRGSALNALESQGDLSRTDPAVQCIWELMEKVNACIPSLERAVDKPFLKK